MKKSYITPNVQIIEIDVEQLIANSPILSNDKASDDEEVRSSEYRNNLWN